MKGGDLLKKCLSVVQGDMLFVSILGKKTKGGNMFKKCFLGFLLFVLVAFSYGVSEAVVGIPDVTNSATLVVPLMEAGISTVENTLTVVNSVCLNDFSIHWEIWDIDGNNINLFGNVDLSDGKTWASDFKTLLSGASAGQLSALTEGSFYRGFMTIDAVTSSTLLTPLDVGYPFFSFNCLTGQTYYVRLLEGAANGIPMVHIEGGVTNPDIFAVGFYTGVDDREEIDNYARYTTELVSNGQAAATDPNGVIDFTIHRVFLSGNGESRIVLWAWSPQGHGATITPQAVKGSPFTYWHFAEDGSQVANTTVNLNHMVNVINVSGDANGTVWINDIPNNFHTYAFSFNSAEYTADPSLTWEAMFESTVIAQWP